MLTTTHSTATTRRSREGQQQERNRDGTKKHGGGDQEESAVRMLNNWTGLIAHHEGGRSKTVLRGTRAHVTASASWGILVYKEEGAARPEEVRRNSNQGQN